MFPCICVALPSADAAASAVQPGGVNSLPKCEARKQVVAFRKAKLAFAKAKAKVASLQKKLSAKQKKLKTNPALTKFAEAKPVDPEEVPDWQGRKTKHATRRATRRLLRTKVKTEIDTVQSALKPAVAARDTARVARRAARLAAAAAVTQCEKAFNFYTAAVGGRAALADPGALREVDLHVSA